MPSPATHLRAPLLWVLAPLMAGITIAGWISPPESGLDGLVCAAFVMGSIALLFGGRPGRIAAIVWAVALSVSTGVSGFILMHVRSPFPADDAAPPREVTVGMEVQHTFPAAPAARQLSGLARITQAGTDDEPLAGRLVYFSAIRRISVPPVRSGRYVIRGVLEPLPREPAPVGFNDYLVNLGVHYRLTRAQVLRETEAPGRFRVFCDRAQKRMEAILRHGLADQPKAASIYLGMLLGVKAELTPEQENAYMRSGTFHVFSISGLHVGIIGLALYATCRFLRVPRLGVAAITLVTLWFYVQITGGSAPAMRAFVMIACVTAAKNLRLPGNPLAGLTAAALLTLLLDPVQLFSTGFQMSYVVVTALVTMGRPLSEKWLARWKPFALLPRGDWRWWHHRIAQSGTSVIRSLAAAWTAFLASTPAGIGYFALLSPGSLPANLIVVPLSVLVIWAGFISLLAGLLGLSWISALANLAAALLVRFIDWLLQHVTDLPAVWYTASYRAAWLAPVSLLLMTLVFLAGAAGRWAPRYGGYWPPAILLALLVIFGVKLG